VKTIVYHQRLGDIINCFPAARHFASQGEEVFIECLPQYASALDLISYAKWTAPGSREGEILDFQIWPHRYNEYRNSGKSYVDFMYDHPALNGVDRQIILDRVPSGPPPGMPDQYNLLAPLGISQGWKYQRWIFCTKHPKHLATLSFFVKRIIIFIKSTGRLRILSSWRKP